jgi:hypothetical protein
MDGGRSSAWVYSQDGHPWAAQVGKNFSCRSPLPALVGLLAQC